MLIDWNHFTPWTALAGGMILGIAASIFILGSGRILGISGIVAGLLRPRSGDIAWRLSFLLGMAAAPLLYQWVAGINAIRIDASWGMVILAGLLVGLGTRYGSGCTSGHGVCGIARLSPRSLVATLCFMATGFASVYVIRHLLA